MDERPQTVPPEPESGPGSGSSAFAGPAYQPLTPWAALPALGMTVAVMVVSLMIAGMVGFAFIALSQNGSADPKAMPTPEALMPLMLPAMLVSQIAMAVLTWVLAGQMRGIPRDVLALRPPRGDLLSTVLIVIGFVVASYALAALINFASGSTGAQDTKQLLPIVTTSLWPLSFVIITVGAAISEEFLFRGFLFSALARSPLGLVGASVVSSALWAVIHWYTWQGVLTIFCMGLMLSYILIRTGSLQTAILCHAIFNGCSFMVMVGIAQSGTQL